MTELLVTDPGQRGRLSIADRVIERIAAQAALGVDGVVETTSALGKVVGRQLPKISSDVQGNDVRLSVDVAVTWPKPLRDVVRQVRDDVIRDVEAIAGKHVRSVDVTVAKMERPPQAPVRRVR